MRKLAQLLRDEMEQRGLTIRKAAKAIGISHVTVTRILAAYPVDIQTMQTVCDWLGVTIADVIDQKPDNDNLAKKLAVLINQEPRLGAALTDALIEVEEGRMSPDDLRDIADYANYKITQHRERRAHAEQPGGNSEST